MSWGSKRYRGTWWDTTAHTVAADGTPLFFATGGNPEGPCIAFANGVGVSTFFWDYIGNYFKDTHRLLVWDYRGHGASDAPGKTSPISMAEIAENMARVMDAAKMEEAVMVGHSMGCQVILEFAHLFGERTLALVPMLGTFRHAAETFIDPRVGPLVFRGLYKLGRKMPEVLGLAMQAGMREELVYRFAKRAGLVHRDLAKREDMDNYLAHIAQVDVGVFFEMARAAQEHDASPYLGDLAMPALVVAGENDLLTPFALSEEMVQRLPNAELLFIPKGSHAALIEQPDLINLRLEKFFRERVSAFTKSRQASAAERIPV